MVTLSEAYEDFQSEILPSLIEQYGPDDDVAFSEAWNNYTDSLCKCNDLTDLQYHYAPSYGETIPDDDIDYLMQCCDIDFKITQISQRLDDLSDWPSDASHWSFTMWRNGKQYLSGNYSQGSAYGNTTPDDKDIFYCAIQDASGNFESFEGWCAECGYDEDSRKAHKIYKACKRTHRALIKMLGEKELEKWRDMFQDY